VIAVLAADGEDVAAAAAGGEATTPKAAPAPVAAETPAPAVAVVAAPAAPAAPGPVSHGGRPFSSPLARRLARDAGLDLALISGSGPHGRVVKSDVEKAVAAGTGKAVQAPVTAAPVTAGATPAPQVATGMADDAVLKLFEPGSYDVLPHDGMRKTIAKRLTESHQSVPSYFVSMDCELDALLKLRAEINRATPMIKTEKGEVPAYKLSVNDFIIKAMALALRDVPMANASWTSSARIKHKHSDVGVAVAIPDGLITPIIRKAESKTLSVISNEMKDLARRARDKKLKPEEYQGGTTAVSNLGMFGVSNFTSIINPPHASILSVGAGVEKPVVKNGEIKIATVMTVTFAFDHRVIDGALGSELAAAFQKHIQNPMGMLV
jgi:pyruvate dehydrogenase E2 component (dihydrolipoamide acetyltransferase)